MIWQVSATANLLLLMAYGVLAFDMGRGLFKQGGWRGNPVGVATFSIFAACAIGHGVHAEHALLGSLWGGEGTQAAARSALAAPAVWTWHALTAGVVMGYVVLRQRLRLLHSGKSLTEDLEHEAAINERINGIVAQRLRQARTAIAARDLVQAEAMLEAAISEAGDLATELAVPAHIRPGVLRGPS